MSKSGSQSQIFSPKIPMTIMMLDKFYVTREGLEKVKAEYERLRDFKRQKTMGETPNLLHSEDANPEYLAFQEDMSLMDTKIAEYENILQNAELIVCPPQKMQNVIGLGARVTVEVDGRSDEFEIVGTLEANPSVGRISNESPAGRELFGKKVGDIVDVHSSVHVYYKILHISYRNAKRG